MLKKSDCQGIQCSGRGYWTDIGNLRKELLDLIDSKGLDPQKLPTNRELRLMGANQLCNAIEYHGGFSSVAQQLRSHIIASPQTSISCKAFLARITPIFAGVFKAQGAPGLSNGADPFGSSTESLLKRILGIWLLL